MRILITGIAGFVGSSIARELVELGYKITGIDDFSFGYLSRVQDLTDKIQIKVGKQEKILSELELKQDIIINCAATAPLPANEIDHYASIKNNVATCGAIMGYASRKNVKKVIHFSSAAVYEGIPNGKDNPLSENIKIKPKLMYPVSKWLSEEYMRVQAEVHKIKTFSLRLFNLYGPHQDYFRDQPPLIGYLLKTLLNKECAKIYGKKNCKRDYVYIDDLIRFLLILINSNPRQGYYDVINVGGGKSFDVYDIIKELNRVSGSELAFKKANPVYFWNDYEQASARKIILPSNLLKAEVDKVAYADLSKAKMYGYKPMFEMKDGLEACLSHANAYFR